MNEDDTIRRLKRWTKDQLNERIQELSAVSGADISAVLAEASWTVDEYLRYRLDETNDNSKKLRDILKKKQQ